MTGPTEPGKSPGLNRRDAVKGALLVSGAGLAGLGAAPGTAAAAETEAESAAAAASFTNPLALQRADPHIFKHTDGNYYFTATAPEYDRIILRRAATLSGLATAPESVIWTKHPSGEMGAHIWAPEIHHIDGAWYIYFAAGRTDDVWAIRMYVLENRSADPFAETWTEKARIQTPWDTFSLDATTFAHNGVRYLSWAQSEPGIDTGTNVYLARMSNPWTITGSTTRLTMPTNDWETRGHKVNEGPAAIVRNGRVVLTFSASATDANYCLGLLTASASSDLLDPGSWTKSAQPVFRSNDATGQYGPGHNSFTVSEDGADDVLVYHARNYRDIDGEPLYDPNRHTRLQKVYWNADGTPNFGIPVSDGETPYRFSSHNFPDRYIRHWEYRGKVEPDVANLADSQYRIMPGLAGTGAVSLESANFPGYYLRDRDSEVWVEQDDGSEGFARDATFHRRTGLADASGVSFESYARAGAYIRHYDFELRVDAVNTATGRADATYHQE